MTEPTRVGDVIEGKYRVERVLGRGGMGVVVAARHLRLGHWVAIKFPVSRVSLRGDAVERLLREARAAMQIRSEHVARVHDVGLDDGGAPYLVMEYLKGQDLGALLVERGPMAIDLAVEYVLQASEALAEAHAHGIIHRDLKPSNLFLSQRSDGSPLVKIIDFGIAKSTGSEAQITLTDSGALLGSPHFMAPEQMRGMPDIDARADIWALGATLYTLLAGEPPFPGKNLLELYDRILAGAPRLRERRPEAPAALEAACLRCMQLDRADRPASVAELAEALAEVAPFHARGSALRARRTLEATTAAQESDAALATEASLPNAGLELSSEGAVSGTARHWAASWDDERSPLAYEPTKSHLALSVSANGRVARPLHQLRRRAIVSVGASGVLLLSALGLLRWSRTSERLQPATSNSTTAARTPHVEMARAPDLPSASAAASAVPSSAAASSAPGSWPNLQPRASAHVTVPRRPQSSSEPVGSATANAAREQDPLADPN